MNEKKFSVYTLDSKLELGNTEYIGTGIYQIDQTLQGGGRRKELATVLAQWQHGKSTVLTIIGANCYNKGYKVLHLVLEDFWADTQENYKKIVNQTSTGNLWILDGSGEIVKLFDLDNLINEYKPDVMIIDYAELIQGTYKIGDTGKRHLLRENFIELRRLASKFNCLIWTAHQAQVGYYAEGKPILRLTPDRVSECRAIGATTDILLGFALADPFDQFIYTTVMKAKHRPKANPDFFKLAVDFSQPRIWSI